MPNATCPFCTIEATRNRSIAENEHAWSFPTNIPVTPGHTLIVPRRCVPKFNDLTEEEMLAIFNLKQKITKALEKTFGSEGFNFAWNENEIGGQSVPHFHLHIVPRKEGDKGIYEYDPRKFLYRPGSREKSPEDELTAVAKLIRENLS